MNKKFTLLAAGLMAVSSLTVSAAEDQSAVNPIPSTEWVGNNYYYLKVQAGHYLAIHSTNRDSVVMNQSLGGTKEAKDLALWKIVYAGTETSSNVYQFVNKKTKQVLSFAKDLKAAPVLAEGIDKWSFSDAGQGQISAKLNSTKTMVLMRDENNNNKIVFEEGTAMSFTVVAPEKDYLMKSSELGDGFTTFQLSFGEKIEGDIFSGKDLIAVTKVGDNNIEGGYFMLQEKGNEAYADGTKKYFGIDTLKVEGASNSFSLDSIRTTIKPNADAKLFKFTADLKNDSLTMIIKGIPSTEDETKAGADSNTDVKVVYAQLDSKKVLTINNTGIKNYPCITASRGVPAEIAGGTGVYFLKSASKTETGGKYISSYNKEGGKIVTMAGTPSVNQPEGQWYIKEEGGMYSIVDRKSGTSLLLKGEVFAVQGMANTFTFGGSADSITVELQEVNLGDKFLGSANFTKEEIANNGYALNLIPANAETSNSYAMTADSILQIKSGDAKDAFIFKLETVGEPVAIGGAKALGDTLFIMNYKLKSQFSNKYVAYDTDKKSLKISDYTDAAVFKFNTNVDGEKYNLQIVDGTNQNKYVTADSYSSNMVLLETPAYFNFVEVEAPEYGTFETGYKRFTSDGKSLTMNTLNLFAELKSEGQEILKSTYEKDNFSLKLIKSEASTLEMPLYFITTAMANEAGKAEAVQTRYYMVSGRDSSLVDAKDNYRVHFIANDTIETMKDSKANPALWALKVTENGNYRLENYQEMNGDITEEQKRLYVGVTDNVVVMSTTGIEFSLEAAPAPVANESIEAPNAIKVIGGVGEFSIRNAGGKRITLSNILGQTIGTRILSSDNVSVPVARGVVIVSVEGDKAYKVIVK